MTSPEPTDNGGEQPLRNKIAFLNGIFLLVAVLAGGLGFYRWWISHPLAAIDFLIAGSGALLWLYLRRHPGRVELVANLALGLGFVLFFAVFLLAPSQGSRLSLFFLHSAAACV